MANKYWLRRTLSGFGPADTRTEGRIDRFKLGELVGVEFKKVRSPNHHRFFFAMLREVLKHQEYYKSEAHLLHGLKFYLGMIENEIHLKDGRTTFELQSIAFDKMDEYEFTALVRKAQDFVAAEVLPKISREEIRQMVEGFL